jgi:hypothetical protein
LNFASKSPPKRVNKILWSSSESDDSDNDEKVKEERQTLTDEVTIKMNMSPAVSTPPISPSKAVNLINTPGNLPKIPSHEVLMDSDLLDKVNSSQNLNDEILEFKQENSSDEIGNAFLHKTSSNKRRNLLELKPKKKVKFMKYESDDD